MKIYLGIVLGVFLSTHTPAQPAFEWLYKYNHILDDFGRSVTIDHNNNVYFTGHSGAYYSGSNGGFIGKLDSTQLLWEYSPHLITFPSGKMRPRKITTDTTGHIYVLFELEGSVVFGNDTVTTPNGLHLVKLLDSTLIWHIELPGANGNGPIYQLVTTASGTCYVMSEFYNSVNVGPFPLTSVGGSDVYVVKVSTNGNFIWAERYGHTSSSQSDVVKGLSLDSFENVYAYWSRAYSTAGGDAYSYITKLDSSGTLDHQTQITGLGNGYFEIGGFTTSASGNCYITFYLDGQSTPCKDTTFNLNQGGIVLMDYDNAGNLNNCKVLLDTINANMLQAATIKVNSRKDVFIGGKAWYTYYIESDTLVPAFFLLSYDSLMNMHWTKSLGITQGGGNTYARLLELAVNDDALVFICHADDNAILFDSVSYNTHWHDVFIGSINVSDTTTSGIETLNSSLAPNIFPNPAGEYVTIDLHKVGFNHTGELILRDMNGKILVREKFPNTGNINLDIADYVSGLYILSVQIEGKTFIYKLVKY